MTAGSMQVGGGFSKVVVRGAEPSGGGHGVSPVSDSPAGTAVIGASVVVGNVGGVVVEVDGIHHVSAQAVVPDALRHNEVTLANAVVLRLPVLGFRVAPDDFFDQIARALIAAGWTGEAAA